MLFPDGGSLEPAGRTTTGFGPNLRAELGHHHISGGLGVHHLGFRHDHVSDGLGPHLGFKTLADQTLKNV